MENGCRVVAAGNPSQAYQIIEHDTPHLIVVDFTTNQPTVVKFLKLLKTLNLPQVPIILLADQSSEDLARQQDVSEVILKDEQFADAVTEFARKRFAVSEPTDIAPRSMLF